MGKVLTSAGECLELIEAAAAVQVDSSGTHLDCASGRTVSIHSRLRCGKRSKSDAAYLLVLLELCEEGRVRDYEARGLEYLYLRGRVEFSKRERGYRVT